jgi:phosphatidylinositol kinase/protein kinase (PI-3  family)
MTEDEAANAFYELMYQHVTERFEKLKSGNRKIAHYTSAENAMNIINGKTIWLRNAALMNDFMEIRYGKQRLLVALQQRLSEIETLFNSNHNGLAAEVFNWLADAEFTVNSQTYLTSFAEHPADDGLGKLSMWRAYGGPVAGVAIVFNTEVFESDKELRSPWHLP